MNLSVLSIAIDLWMNLSVSYLLQLILVKLCVPYLHITTDLRVSLSLSYLLQLTCGCTWVSLIFYNWSVGEPLACSNYYKWSVGELECVFSITTDLWVNLSVSYLLQPICEENWVCLLYYNWFLREPEYVLYPNVWVNLRAYLYDCSVEEPEISNRRRSKRNPLVGAKLPTTHGFHPVP